MTPQTFFFELSAFSREQVADQLLWGWRFDAAEYAEYVDAPSAEWLASLRDVVVRWEAS